MADNQKKIHRCTHMGCNSSFNRPYRLVQHLLLHNNVRPFQCPAENCSSSYTSNSHLKRHINSVHVKPEISVIYSCPICLKIYANRQNLKRHMTISHELKVPFSCDICKLQFRKKHRLSAHMYRHTGIKAFSCHICSEEFVSLIKKKSHLHHHKTFSCEQCPLIFSQWSKYQRHLRVEHGPKEFICDSCGRNFNQRNHLVRHVKIHDLSRIFPCPYENCNRFYSRNSNLRQHIMIKHEKIKHRCMICEAQLCTKAKLDEHVLKRHSGNPPVRRTPKTKATGRKTRKDFGIPKTPMAAKLAGLIEEPLEVCEVVMTNPKNE